MIENCMALLLTNMISDINGLSFFNSISILVDRPVPVKVLFHNACEFLKCRNTCFMYIFLCVIFYES